MTLPSDFCPEDEAVGPFTESDIHTPATELYNPKYYSTGICVENIILLAVQQSKESNTALCLEEKYKCLDSVIHYVVCLAKGT
jgi:hypothetical protein